METVYTRTAAGDVRIPSMSQPAIVPPITKATAAITAISSRGNRIVGTL